MSPLIKTSRNNVLSLLLWAGVATLAIGFVVTRMWEYIPMGRARESAKCALIAFVLAWLVNRFSRVRLANLLVLIWGAALVYFIGPLPILAIALTALSALALGSVIIPANYGRSVVLPMVLGFAFMVGVVGWLLPFPIHYQWVYLIVLVAPVALRWREVFGRIQASAGRWQQALDETPYTAAFAVMVVGIASTGCWMPTVQFDDLAYHLGMPSQLMALGYYRLDLFSQMWALVPWAGDIVQSIAQVLAGQEARGAVDAMWLVASSALVWRLAETLKVPVYARWLASALYASLPLTTALAGGMQAEMPATTIMLALALSVTEAPEQPSTRVFCVVSALAGLMLAVKTGFIAATIPIGVWLLWRWRARIPLKAILPSFAIVIFTAGSSYVYAYVLSGNPMLPLMNGIFHSPFIPPGNFSGTPYTAGGGLTMPWQMTFHTRLFIEGWDGAAGVSFLGLLGAFIATLFMPALRPYALVAAVAFLIPFEAINYYRYAYPALVLTIPVTVAAAAAMISRRNLIVLLVLLIPLNLLYQGCSYYVLQQPTMQRHHKFSRENIFTRFIPERLMAQFIREQSTTDAVLFCDPRRPFFAELAGRGFTVSAYDTELTDIYWKVENDVSGNGWRDLFTHTGVRYAVTSEPTRSAALTAALSDAKKIRQIGATELWLLPVDPGPSSLSSLRDLAVTRFRP